LFLIWPKVSNHADQRLPLGDFIKAESSGRANFWQRLGPAAGGWHLVVATLRSHTTVAHQPLGVSWVGIGSGRRQEN
jgi:hypothetical protein